jgi:hypothetical protein
MNNEDVTLEEIAKELIELSKSLDIQICTPMYIPYPYVESNFETFKDMHSSRCITNIADFTI